MASQGPEAPGTSTGEQQQQQALEMDTLPSTSNETQSPHKRDGEAESAQPTAEHSSQPSLPEPPAPAPLARTETEALGPATDTPVATTGAPITGSALSISLMLTTGARHPYHITERYLNNRKTEARNVDGNFDPRELTGYKLKELIWTDWRSEWESRPAAPSSIRLIIWGKMVDDKKTLKEYSFSLENTNIVHMTVKPADFTEDEEMKGTGKAGTLRGHDGGERGAGCRCVIL